MADQTPFAARMDNVHRSFIREILKVTADPSIISFAGGLPNPKLFPLAEMARAAAEVIGEQGGQALQYSTTEGHPQLRRFIARRYAERFGLDVDPDEILITTGSQQALDLIGKVFVDPGAPVIVERPGYLGALQAFSVFEPEFLPVDLEEDGPDLDGLERALAKGSPRPARAYYAVTNFQNPSGLTYGPDKRRAVADMLADAETLFVEDDPYGELRFAGEHQPPVFALRPENSLLLGTFSKVAAPGFRVGWIVARSPARDKLVVAKQAADLHTSTVCQRILSRYLETNDLDAHIERIRENYGSQARVMVDALERHMPSEVRFTRPQGGMFCWAALPEGASSMDLLEAAIKEKVAFVPGRAFYTDGTGGNTMRLNFSNSDAERIEDGVARLGRCARDYLASRKSGAC